MAILAEPELSRSFWHRVSSVLTLARWRWRQHWFLLLMTWLGVVAAVMMVCAVPLTSTVMQTAGLRDVLRATPRRSEIDLEVNIAGLSTPAARKAFQAINPLVQQHLGNYLAGAPQFEVQTVNFNLLSPRLPTNSLFQLDGTSMQQSAAHVTLVRGRLPRPLSDDLEVALTPRAAAALHAGIGSLITLDAPYYGVSFSRQALSGTQQQPIANHLVLHVVGLFNVRAGDPFWHNNFLPTTDFTGTHIYFMALASDQTLLSTFDALARQADSGEAYFPRPSTLFWYYHLAPARIGIDQLNDLIARLNAFQAGIASQFGDTSTLELAPPYMTNVAASGEVFGSQQPGPLQQFRDRLSLARVSAEILGIQITALLLFFVVLMAELLVEREAEVIAVLRSRGASGSQVLSALSSQGLVLCLVALCLGPPLALLASGSISPQLLPADLRDASNVLARAPLQALWGIRWYALVIVAVALVVLVMALRRAAQLDVLTLRREAARSTRPSFWLRLNLDLVAVVIALTGYGLSWYLSSVGGLLNAQTQALIAEPLALIAPVFLFLALVLLFLRFFPLLLRLLSRFALRSRGAAFMLALVQMLRMPRQAVRLILLLGFAIAFAGFGLALSASQTQRAQDIASFQAGADFSGDVPGVTNNFTLQEQIARYRSIPGVLAASAGYTDEGVISLGTLATSATLTVQMRAVDPATFLQATGTSASNTSPLLPALLKQLVELRQGVLQNGRLPVIVDATTWNALGLQNGATFTLAQQGGAGSGVPCVVLAEVPYIPTVSSSVEGGVLMDYQSFAAFMHEQDLTVLPNHIWLRTGDGAPALAHVRAALQTVSLHLDNLVDRRALSSTLHADPLALNLIAILSIGAATALLLALIANLLVSWQSVRARLMGFTLLRALGSPPQQIARMLLWEQGLVYVTALVAGGIFGALLILTVVPTLIFSSVPSSGPLSEMSTEEFYALQNAVPVRVVVPSAVWFAFAILALIGLLALLMMVRVVLRPTLGQVLRIDED